MDKLTTIPANISITRQKQARGQIIGLERLVWYQSNQNKTNKSKTRKAGVAEAIYSLEYDSNQSFFSIVEERLGALFHLEIIKIIICQIPELWPKISSKEFCVYADNLATYCHFYITYALKDKDRKCLDKNGFYRIPKYKQEPWTFFCRPKLEKGLLTTFPSGVDCLPEYLVGLLNVNINRDNPFILLDGVIGSEGCYSKICSRNGFNIKKRILYISNKFGHDEISLELQPFFETGLLNTSEELVDPKNKFNWLWYFNTYQVTSEKYQHVILYSNVLFMHEKLGMINALDLVVINNFLCYVRSLEHASKRLSHYIDVARPLQNFLCCNVNTMKILGVHLHCLRWGVVLQEWAERMGSSYEDDAILETALKFFDRNLEFSEVEESMKRDEVILYKPWYDIDSLDAYAPILVQPALADPSQKEQINMTDDHSIRRAQQFVRATIVNQLPIHNRKVLVVNDYGGCEVNSIAAMRPSKAVWYDHKYLDMPEVERRCGETPKGSKECRLNKNKYAIYPYRGSDMPMTWTFDFGFCFNRGGDLELYDAGVSDASADMIKEGKLSMKLVGRCKYFVLIAAGEDGVIDDPMIYYGGGHFKYKRITRSWKEDGFLVKSIFAPGKKVTKENMLQYYDRLMNQQSKTHHNIMNGMELTSAGRKLFSMHNIWTIQDQK